MVVTSDTSLPTHEELNVQEINVSISGLKAGAFHLGKQCEHSNNEFMLCRVETKDPRKCIGEGKQVTKCTLDFFRNLKMSCKEEFTNHAYCIERSSRKMSFEHCRKSQEIFDKCVFDKLNLKRPPYGYFTQVKIHETARPKPEEPPPAHYPDAPSPLPPKEDYPPARFGSRFVY